MPPTWPSPKRLLKVKGDAKLYYSEGEMPYSEESRRYRRTVYAHDDWLRHRSSSRFFLNLTTILKSGLVRSLAPEISVVGTIGVVVCAWNAAVGGYLDIHNVPHEPLLRGVPSCLICSLPVLPFTLASPALGLLLLFRTNASYSRWVEVGIRASPGVRGTAVVRKLNS